jgi:predicted enzyme related to lactoylglutathione lyase
MLKFVCGLSLLASSIVFGSTAEAQDTLKPGYMQTKLIVDNLDKGAAFYSAVLGLTQAMRFHDVMDHRPMEEVMLKDAAGTSHPLVLIKFQDRPPTHAQAVLVFFTEDIDALVGRVQQAGGRLSERRDDTAHHVRIAFWYDPEGNLAETVQMGARQAQ